MLCFDYIVYFIIVKHNGMAPIKIEGMRFDSRQWERYLFSKVSSPAVKSTQPIQREPGILPWGLRSGGSKLATHLCLIEVKIGWGYTSTPPCDLVACTGINLS
jgi:hypothetical protein